MEHIIIIGGGGTAGALAYDLVLRGFNVTLFEKGEILSGTTGRHHGLLHSGARYAANDKNAAIECIQENQILKKIAPQALEINDGLFIALNNEDLKYSEIFLEKCEECGIQTRIFDKKHALEIEPNLNQELLLAVQVPDASMDAWRLAFHFFSSAKFHGAKINHFSEIINLHIINNTVIGIRVLDHKSGKKIDCYGDIIVNATGPWAGKITKMANINLSVQPGPGVIVAMEGRHTDMVINRLHPSSIGDIIVPQRNLTILGTSLWLEDDPDKVIIHYEHIEKMIKLCSMMVPLLQNQKIKAFWSASRPLIKPDNNIENPQDITRDFHCHDHKKSDSLEGFISVIGGKATTLRAMAETTADLICKKVGRKIECRTKEIKLLPIKKFYI